MAARSPHPVDLAVGQRLRAARRLRGVSQAQLAEVVGLTFQQIQKYERGENRIAVSILHDMANALHAPMSRLLGEAQAGGEQAGEGQALSLIDGAEAIAILKAFRQVSSPALRKALIGVVEASSELVDP